MLIEKGFEAKFVLQVHDELIFEAPKAEIQELSAQVLGVLERDTLLEDFGVSQFRVKMKAVAHTGLHWGEI